MATVMMMEWEGLTPDQYEEARGKVRWEHERPDGANFHVAGFDGNTLRVVDIWDSQEDFERFAQERLMPGLRELGIDGEPNVRFYPVHAVYAPAYEAAGSSA
jgi:hypothetical protein